MRTRPKAEPSLPNCYNPSICWANRKENKKLGHRWASFFILSQQKPSSHVLVHPTSWPLAFSFTPGCMGKCGGKGTCACLIVLGNCGYHQMHTEPVYEELAIRNLLWRTLPFAKNAMAIRQARANLPMGSFHKRTFLDCLWHPLSPNRFATNLRR